MSHISAFVSTPAPKTDSFRQLFRLVFCLALLPVLLVGGRTWAQTAASEPADQKVKKVFYSAKDRLEAMHAASLFTPKAVADWGERRWTL